MAKRKKTESFVFKMMKNDTRITLAWAGTLVTSPFIIMPLLLISTKVTRFEIKDFFTFYFLFLFIGSLCAIPTLLLLLTSNYFLQKYNWWNKLFISSLGTSFIFLSFLMISSDYYLDLTSLILQVIYCILFSFFIFYIDKINLYKLRNRLKNWF